jgi:hypothetical protein
MGASQAQEMRLSAGVKAGLELQNLVATFDRTALTEQITSITKKDSQMLNLGAYIDAEYLMLGANFATRFANTLVTTTYSHPVTSTSTFTTQVVASNVEMYVAAKLPLKLLLGVTVFPLVGVEYDLNLFLDGKDDLTDAQKLDLNQYFAIVGVGADLYLNEVVYLRPVITAGLNLKPGPTVLAPRYDGYKLDAGVSLGYLF